MARTDLPAASTGVFKRVMLGRAFSSARLEHTLLPKVLALPVFASDALSSVAYATGEILLVLTVATTAPQAVRAPDRGRSLAADGARDRLVPPDGARLPGRGRRLHREQGEPGPGSRARRGRRPALRLHDDRRRLDRGRGVRDRVGVARRQRARGRALDLLRGLRHAREPARLEGVGRVVRDPDVRVRALDR